MDSDNIINEKILASIKKLLGILPDITVFDEDIALHINTVFASLIQMGVGPQEGFMITSADDEWSSFFGPETETYNPLLIENVKTYVYLKVKLVFDPPQSQTVLNSFEKHAAELEYRLYTQMGGY